MVDILTPKELVKKGEIAIIKGYRFKVESVGRKSIVLHFLGPITSKHRIQIMEPSPNTEVIT